MKKIPKKQRERDVKLGLDNRKGRKSSLNRKKSRMSGSAWLPTNHWIDKYDGNGLSLVIDKRRRIILYLPEVMNFYGDYDTTVLYISAIRRLAETNRLSSKAYKLASVNFDNLKNISTSSALVLTAELSKWDDSIRQRLRPNVDNWDKEILRQFTDIGFFDLFQSPPPITINSDGESTRKLVRYIKGRCGDSKKTRILNEKLTDIVGDKINKWTFLRGGLDEAITNVSHHAYPDHNRFSDDDKNWYLTGSYNESTKEIKIVFYDQGVGIPKSLPTSEIWEKALSFLTKIKVPIADRKKDEVLLKAAVELDRTSTEESDRGKGLQDLMEFIRQRGEGYISIISLKGLYKLTIREGNETIKTEHFDNGVCGTLIIWSAILAD